MITAQKVPISPNRLTVWNCGIMIAWAGIIIVDRMTTKSRPRPGKRSLAKA